MIQLVWIKLAYRAQQANSSDLVIHDIEVTNILILQMKIMSL
jgi:hypothetical protein